jgi:hypothetical protein
MGLEQQRAACEADFATNAESSILSMMRKLTRCVRPCSGSSGRGRRTDIRLTASKFPV